MSVAATVDEFIERMIEVLGEEVSSWPTADQIRRYFRSLNGRTQDAIEAYEGYASLFYIHVGETGGSSVTYDEGPSDQFCDGWETDILTRPIHSDGRQIIDCEGFSVMAVELLAEAGFRLIHYMMAVALSARIEGGTFHGGMLHVIAAIQSSDGQNFFVGNDRIYRSAAAAVDELDTWNELDETNVRFGFGNTVREAAYDAHEIIMERQSDRFHEDRVAPFRPRPTVSPPRRNP